MFFFPAAGASRDISSHQAYLGKVIYQLEKSHDVMLTTKFQTIPEPFFPYKVYIRLPSIIELFCVSHFVCLGITRAEEVGDLDRALKVLNKHSLLHCKEAVNLHTVIYVIHTGQRQYHTRKDGEAVLRYGLGNVNGCMDTISRRKVRPLAHPRHHRVARSHARQ